MIPLLMTMSLTLSATPPGIEELLDAIEIVETGSQRDPDHAVGDNGASLGRYQIGFDYWLDATGNRRCPSSRRSYLRTAMSRELSRRCVAGYWKRHAASALRLHDLERLARIHNGGPQGANPRYRDKYRMTTRYWNLVRQQLTKQKDGVR